MPQPVVNTANQVNSQPTGMPVNPFLGSLGLGGNPGTVTGPYGTPVTPDADNRGFTNADGGHDWNVGKGPGGNFGGQVNKTGLAPVGTNPGSGDDLGFERNSPEYNQATARHKAWIQQNLDSGRTLADLGLSPTKGGGLSNYMELGSGLFAGRNPGGSTTPGNPTTPINPTGPVDPATGKPLPVPSTPITSPVASLRGTAPTGTPANTAPGMVTNSVGLGTAPLGGYNPISVPGGNNVAPGINPVAPAPTPTQPMTAQKRMRTNQPMGSLGFTSTPMNTARVM